MAFDHTGNRLNGMYDFADSGFGPLHQEFIYSDWITPDLTARIVAEYELLTGLALDRQRIDLLNGVLRLSELAEFADDADPAAAMVQMSRRGPRASDPAAPSDPWPLARRGWHRRPALAQSAPSRGAAHTRREDQR
jgi:hypothetical protein